MVNDVDGHLRQETIAHLATNSMILGENTGRFLGQDPHMGPLTMAHNTSLAGGWTEVHRCRGRNQAAEDVT